MAVPRSLRCQNEISQTFDTLSYTYPIETILGEAHQILKLFKRQ